MVLSLAAAVVVAVDSLWKLKTNPPFVEEEEEALAATEVTDAVAETTLLTAAEADAVAMEAALATTAEDEVPTAVAAEEAVARVAEAVADTSELGATKTPEHDGKSVITSIVTTETTLTVTIPSAPVVVDVLGAVTVGAAVGRAAEVMAAEPLAAEAATLTLETEALAVADIEATDALDTAAVADVEALLATLSI